MGRAKKIKNLGVFLNDMQVGVLTKDTTANLIFSYHQDWLEHGFAISNSLPLRESSFKGEVVTRFLDNLLPDHNELKKLVATKFGAQSTRPFDMLEVIGRDCVGALSFLPEGFGPKNIYDLKYKPISDSEIEKRLKGLSSTTPLGMKEEDFRISLAGAQEKTAFLKLDNKWYEPIGLTPTTHIFKRSLRALGIDADFSDSVDNEYFSLKILEYLGLEVCSADIQHFNNERVLVVERFDRKWRDIDGQKTLIRIPQEDLCQALEVSPYQKYQTDGGPGIIDIANFLRSSTNDMDRINFFKAILIFDLLYATDGHAKNFSVFLNSRGFKLTPFYDVMSGYFLYAREKYALEKLKLAMKVGDSGHYAFKRITLKHYQQTAARCGISTVHFQELLHDLHYKFKSFKFDKSLYSSSLNQDTAQMIVAGMTKRSQILFS